ncbi:MAG TPA: Do family serine endopeptidase [Cyclobacteriaceae bacterium]|nr:Do family serine endopeptidase [Cyclobacteriaceae bacterium]
MRKFVSLMLAAVMGSAITVAITGAWKNDNDGVRIEHVTGAPFTQVGYKKNDKGEIVPLDFTATAEKVTAAVVHIRSTSTGRVSQRREQQQDPWQYFFGPQGPQQRGPSMSAGSGVIINADGYIVTNNHVVDGADKVDVTLSNNRTYPADVLGTDPDTDLAVIKINQKNLPALAFVDSDNVKVGEWVLAVGNPFNLNSTVTAGIVSAKGRNIGIINSNSSDQEATRTAIESFIQTDAAINPGNSGGALVNVDGGLIGINTAIASQTGQYAGYGFAVPANIVSKIVEDIIGFGTVQRGWLGIQVGTVNQDLVSDKKLKVEDGAYVSGFADGGISAAEKAGLKEGDVITKLDNHEIRTSTALIEYIGRKRPGDKISVTIDRFGKEMIIPVTLTNRAGAAEIAKRGDNAPAGLATLGINLEDIESGELKDLDLNHGVRVKDLANGKVARYTDMKEGFIITSIDNTPVKSAKEANELLKKKKSGETILFAGVYEDYPREYIYALRM